MRIREHHGFGHGLTPGHDSDLNCPSCKTEAALGVLPRFADDTTMTGVFALLTDTENDTLWRKLFSARVDHMGTIDKGVDAELRDINRDLHEAMRIRHPYGRDR